MGDTQDQCRTEGWGLPPGTSFLTSFEGPPLQAHGAGDFSATGQRELEPRKPQVLGSPALWDRGQ